MKKLILLLFCLSAFLLLPGCKKEEKNKEPNNPTDNPFFGVWEQVGSSGEVTVEFTATTWIAKSSGSTYNSGTYIFDGNDALIKITNKGMGSAGVGETGNATISGNTMTTSNFSDPYMNSQFTKKGGGGSGGGGGTSGLVSRINFDDGSFIDYKYDSQNRLISAVMNNNETLSTLTYPSANKVEAVLEGEKWVFTLNGEGCVTKAQGEEYDWLYEYENGYLTKTTQIWGGSVLDWESGNLKLISEQDGPNTETYSYGSTPNKETSISAWASPLIEVWSYQLPSAFFGKKSQNLATSNTYSNGSVTTTTTYSYVTNTNGYVTKATYTRIDDGSTKTGWLEVIYK